MAQKRISGTLAAAVTPLRDRGDRLDEAAVPPLFEFYRSGELDGLLVLGTTGEGVLLSADERRRLAELAVAHAGDLAVAVHCGAQSTGETVALAAHAAQAGADAVAVIGPPYFALDSDELLEHFAAAAHACAPVPFYVYEFEARSGYAVPPTMLDRLRERAPNLTGMKVSDAPFERVAAYLATGLDVFIGAESVVLEGMAHGAAGAVSGVAAAFPEVVAALVREPTPERSRRAQSFRTALSRANFQASVKAALALRGVAIEPSVRAPLRPLTPEAVERLAEELRGIGALLSSA